LEGLVDKITLYKNTSKPVVALQILDAAGAPRDITGWAISVRLGYLARTAIERALVTWVTGGAVTITDAAAGKIAVAVAVGDLASVTPGAQYCVEVKRTTASSEEVLGQLACDVRESLHQ
jgi:hypothetical protein